MRVTALSLAAVIVLPCFAEAPAARIPDELYPPAPDRHLQRELERAVDRLGLAATARRQRLGLALLDLTDADQPRYAAINDQQMIYAASLPKIAVLLAGFESLQEGRLRDTPELQASFLRLIRFSSNDDASLAIRRIGFEYIAQTLRSPRYRLYDQRRSGGLWVGKAYGGPNDRWRRDPLHNLSHGANALQTARFFWMLDAGRLVSPRYSARMKQILGRPGIRHKFVKGLDQIGGRTIYRKSGTWRSWHSDAALVETEDGRRYVAVGLLEHPRGGELLADLIVEVDRLICGPANVVQQIHTD